MRPVFDPTGGPDVLVEKMIGTAYETVKRVYHHLPEIRRLDGVLAEIPTLAQTTADNALAEAMPPIREELAQAVQLSVNWAEGDQPDPTDPSRLSSKGWAKQAEDSAEAAEESALAATKVNMMFPFTSSVSQMIYDVTVISGQTDVNTAGMALWVEGAIEFDFTILSATTFMLNDATAYPENAQMRVILNAHFNDLVHGFDQLLGALEQEYKDAAALNGRWCGVHVVPPTTRLDGGPFQEADEYQNRSDKLRYSWNGSTWVALNSSAQQLEARLANSDLAPSMLLYPGAGGVPQTFGILVKGTDPGIWEWERYVNKPSSDRSTWQWGAAVQACLEQAGDLIFPKGTFKLEREIILPTGDSRVSVTGSGVNTQIVSLLENAGTFLFNSEETIQLNLRDLRMVTPWDEEVRQKDVGLFKTAGTLRGTTLKGLFVAGTYRGIHLGRKTWGRTTIADYNQILLGTEDPALTGACGIFIEGNTVFMRDIEILGRFDKALKIIGSDAVRCEVISLTGFNIAGASSASNMRTAIYTENVNNFKASSGWIENTYNLPTETGGLGPTIVMQKGSANKVENVWLASQSIHIAEQYDTGFDNVRFGNANAGIIPMGGAGGTVNNEITTINLEQWAMTGEDVFNNEIAINGKVVMLDEGKYHITKEGKFADPMFKTSSPAPTSNDSAVVTVVANANEYASGARSFDVTTFVANHGVHFELSGLLPNTRYTFVVVAKIPTGSAVQQLRFLTNNPSYGTAVYGWPTTRIVARNAWHKMYTHMRSDASGRIFLAFGAAVAGKFSIDSFQCWAGYRTDAPH